MTRVPTSSALEAVHHCARLIIGVQFLWNEHMNKSLLAVFAKGFFMAISSVTLQLSVMGRTNERITQADVGEAQ